MRDNLSWDEVKTAYHVARLGKVSAAAAELGIHHATVIRHIDALEQALGRKLFQRHQRGYTMTEAGEELLKTGRAADDEMKQFLARLDGRDQELSGEIIVTAIEGAVPALMPALTDFMADYPNVRLRYESDARLYRLEYGEAHVAIRAGEKPQEPDLVVQPLATTPVHLCASHGYFNANGLPANEGEMTGHRYVGTAGTADRAAFSRWLAAHIAPEDFVFRSADTQARERAIEQGVGIGFVSGKRRDLDDGLVEVFAPRPEWVPKMWMVTHVDLHRSAKVQTLTRYLKKYNLAES